MKSVIEILNELESDNSRLFKIDVLEQNLDNILLERVLKATLDPYTQYYIRKIPDYDRGDKEFRNPLDWALDNLDKLSSRELTGNKAKAHLVEILENLTAGDAEVIERVIGGDLRCGVSTSTVNKVYGKGFISTYPCMLAGAYNQKNFKHIKYPAMVQLKMDGMRANIIITPDGTVDIRSRNGKQIELHGLLDDYMKEIFYTKPTLESLDSFRGSVVDGELIVLAEDMVTILDRKTGNGILNKAVKGTITKEDAKRVRMVAWDLIPLKDFKNSICNIPYFDRIGVLQVRMAEVSNTQPIEYIRPISSIPVDNIDQANDLFKQALDNGEEGIILKNGDSPWEDKRSKYQVKMKAELEADLLVTAWNEGTGRIEGKMGSVTCVSADGGLEVNVGSGFNDEDREMIAEDIVGKIITVKYNEVIQDKRKSTKSLFLPIYIETRLDKTKADIL
jgi:ATP-dependent DNA ligase